MPQVAEAATATLAAAEHVSTADALGESGPDVGAQRMRRVASAPALKHPSCYKEVSPTAAVAAAAAESAARPRRQQLPAQLRSVPPCRSCSGGRCNCLEVYVVSRSFSEFAGPVMKRLHPDAREHLVDMGICHYMTVFKTSDGQLVQFDFGPLGGDVQKAHGPLATFLRRARRAAQQHRQQHGEQEHSSTSSALQPVVDIAVSSAGGGAVGSRGLMHSPSAPSLPMASLDLAREGGEAAVALMHLQDASSSDRPRRGVNGEIRERMLQQLPPACMYMGRTSLTLDDIRNYNAAQGRQTYTLHENDCRHYVNSLVQYTTGVERSTQHLKRHYFHARHVDKWLWYGWFISAAQLVTDVGNWSNIQAGAAVTLLAVTGRSTLASLKTLATPVLPALKSLPALLPSGGLAAAAAAAGPGAAPAAAGASGGGATMIGTLATTLKLPATLLLRRPLAAGAAAGSAGAAAAVMRDPSDPAAAAAAAASNGSSSRGRGSRGGPWRPLHALGDSMAHGFRSAVLGVRRLALGNTRAVRQLQQSQTALNAELRVPAATAAAGARPRFGFWAGRGSSSGLDQQQPARSWFRFRARGPPGNQLQLISQPGSGMLAAPAAAAPAAVGSSWRQPAQEGQLVQQLERRRPLLQLGQTMGRHIAWLGSTAARASGQLAQLAFGGGRGPLARPAGAHQGGLQHSTSSQQLLQQVPAASLATRHRSLSMPSLLTAGPDSAQQACSSAAASSLQASPVAAAGAAACLGGDLGLAGSDLTFLWDSSSSSIAFSSFGSRSAGVGRQVLNLPTPRISWGKRATQAMIVRQ